MGRQEGEHGRCAQMGHEQMGVGQKPRVAGVTGQHERDVEQQLRANGGQQEWRKPALLVREDGERRPEQYGAGQQAGQGRKVTTPGEVPGDREERGEGSKQRTACDTQCPRARIHHIRSLCCLVWPRPAGTGT